jgi:hypothetical protein
MFRTTGSGREQPIRQASKMNTPIALHKAGVWFGPGIPDQLIKPSWFDSRTPRG